MKISFAFINSEHLMETYECEKAEIRRNAGVIEITQNGRAICFPLCNIKSYSPDRSEEMQRRRDKETTTDIGDV